MPNVSVRVNELDLERVEQTLAKVSPARNRAILKRGLTKCALLVQKITVEEKIVRGRYRKDPPLPDRLTSRHGGAGIIGSIGLSLTSDKIATVGSHLVYAPTHELGLGAMPVRAFLSPALDKASEKFGDIFDAIIDEELRK